MATYETHHFQVGDSRVLELRMRPTRVYSWYGLGDPVPPFIPHHNVMSEDMGHDWTWVMGAFRYSGTQVVGHVRGTQSSATVQQPFWLIFQYGEADAPTCLHCGREIESSAVFCPWCGTRR